MIIDLILDRQQGKEYRPKEFYDQVMGYGQTWPEIAFPIAGAMDSGTNDQVQAALQAYVIEQGYNRDLINYIGSVDWVTD